MTKSRDPLVRVLRSARVVLYDFDGPVCDVFSGLPANVIARQLEQLSGERCETDDPMEVLRRVDGSVNLAPVEDALIAAELDAIDLAKTTVGSIESIRAALSARLLVGIVSNNSKVAVDRFLARAGLANDVWPVVGRSYAKPQRMKPNVWPLEVALDALGLPPSAAVYVGDSVTDIEAAQAAQMPCIAYANKPGKRELFEAVGASHVIDSMWELHDAIVSG